ncbi:MAG TPA: response regulator transcription factor [Acidimicrobiales bacterium]|jgi:DNA-binding response OmpR family regulator|nr:response regulator transcription factor [Acidimicrobiales bacterium]
MTNTPTAAPPRVLVLEDDVSMRDALAMVLTAADFEVRTLTDARDLADTVDVFRPDLAILDVSLPRGPDGFEVARTLRAALGIPVVFVTAADSLEDRLHGFEAGADDYLVKPFAMAELLARSRVALRRAGRLASPTYEVRDLVVDEANRVAIRAGTHLPLTKTEFDLLCVMARRPGTVFSKVRLLSLVWGFEEFAPNLVEVHVSALRRKLESAGPRMIHTERGAGYVIRP